MPQGTCPLINLLSYKPYINRIYTRHVLFIYSKNSEIRGKNVGSRIFAFRSDADDCKNPVFKPYSVNIESVVAAHNVMNENKGFFFKISVSIRFPYLYRLGRIIAVFILVEIWQSSAVAPLFKLRERGRDKKIGSGIRGIPDQNNTNQP